MLPLSPFHLFSDMKSKVVFFILLIFFIPACSFNSPVINEVSMVRIYDDRTDSPGRGTCSLACFVSFADEDGEEDFFKLELEYLTSGYIWQVHRDEGYYSKREEKLWFGAFDLRFPMDKVPPEGEYWVRIFDLYGNYGEKNINLPPFAKPAAVFQVNGDRWSLSSSTGRTILFFFDEKAEKTGEMSVTGQGGDLRSLFSGFSGAEYFYSLFIEEKASTGILSGPFYRTPR